MYPGLSRRTGMVAAYVYTSIADRMVGSNKEVCFKSRVQETKNSSSPEFEKQYGFLVQHSSKRITKPIMVNGLFVIVTLLSTSFRQFSPYTRAVVDGIQHWSLC